MKSKNVFGAGLLLLLSIACFLFISNRNKTPKEKAFPWAKVRKDALISMESEDFRKGSSEKYTLSKENGAWVLTKPRRYQTLPEKSAFLATAFMNLKPKDLLTNVSAEEYSAYGLNTPRLRFTAKVKGKEDYNLLFGSNTSIGEDIYVSIEKDKNLAYILPYKDATVFLSGMNGLINDSVLTKNGEDVSEVQFRSIKGERWGFIKTNGFWVQAPSMETNKDWGMRRFLMQAKDLRFETKEIRYQVDPSELPALEIDTNTAPFLSFTFNDKTSSTIYIGSRTEGVYRVYLPEMRLTAVMQAGIVHGFFLTSLKDLEIRKQ